MVDFIVPPSVTSPKRKSTATRAYRKMASVAHTEVDSPKTIRSAQTEAR